MEACVELVRDDYLVMSLPDRGGGIGYAGTQAYNQRSLDPHARFRPGQRLPVTVASLASAHTGVSQGIRAEHSQGHPHRCGVVKVQCFGTCNRRHGRSQDPLSLSLLLLAAGVGCCCLSTQHS